MDCKRLFEQKYFFQKKSKTITTLPFVDKNLGKSTKALSEKPK